MEPQPAFSTFQEIEQMLQRGEIRAWHTGIGEDEYSPNKIMKFYDNTGSHEKIEAIVKYNRQTDQIFSPIMPLIPSRSLIDWMGVGEESHSGLI